MKTRAWISHGFWNVFEHGITRGMDALATLAILWLLPTETFSQLAISQAYVAPLLFFFLSPETILYRDFGKWMAEGKGSALRKIRVFRRFAWLKLAVSFLFAALMAGNFPSPSGSTFGFTERFFGYVWAFSLPLLPQVTGPDREFLRLSLELKTLSFLSFFQRVLYLGLLVGVTTASPQSIPFVALCGLVTAVVTAVVARHQVERRFEGVSETRTEESAIALIRNAIAGFSIWGHISGVIVGWVQTLDLFFLGWAGIGVSEVALYSVILKLSNFTLTIPYAVSNLYQVYLGRAVANASTIRSERGFLIRSTAALFGFSALQGLLFYVFAPQILALFSRGRWSPEDAARMLDWLRFILPACVIFSSSLFMTGWMAIRTSYPRLVAQVYLPWGLVGAICYGSAAFRGGADLAARANIAVMTVFVVLLGISAVRAKRSGPPFQSSL